MRLVQKGHEIIWKVIQQCVRPLAGLPPVNVPRVILDATAIPQHAQHLEVVQRALLDALCFQELTGGVEILEPLGEFRFDALNRWLEAALLDDVVLGGVQHGAG